MYYAQGMFRPWPLLCVLSCSGRYLLLSINYYFCSVNSQRFFQAQDDGNTPQVQTVFCAPTIQAHYIKVVANLNNGSLTDVSATGNFLPQNNVTGVGGALNGSAFNGQVVIYQPSTCWAITMS